MDVPKVDYHIHTYFSPCASRDMLPKNIIAIAERMGLESIAFTDHFYLWSDAKIFDELSIMSEFINKKLKVYIGCEADVISPEKVAIKEEVAKKLDFVMLAHSHYHPHEGEVERPADETSPEVIAKHMVDTFSCAIKFSQVDVIAHPFCLYQTAFSMERGAIYSFLSEKNILPLLELAREKGIAMGIGPQFIVSSEKEFLVPFLKLCKKIGLKFALGSDAHSLTDIGIDVLNPLVKELQLKNNDLWHPKYVD